LPPDSSAYSGLADFTSDTSELNEHTFLFKRLLRGGVWTSGLVEVISVTNAGGLSPVGFVDVSPMVHQVDGKGNATPHGVIHNLPYFRLQGGANAVIIDPVAGDIGGAMFCSRDISAVKATRGANVPGSQRTFDPADGLYFGGWLNGQPTQYIRFSTAGIEIITPATSTITAANVNITASGTATVTAAHANLISADVNLGATGGKKIVLDGDPVVGGVVQASSTKVKGV
jgi:hypothetical protein